MFRVYLSQNIRIFKSSLAKIPNISSVIVLRKQFFKNALQLNDITSVSSLKSEGENVKKYEGFISNRYSIGDAPNGGYLASLAISAARVELNDDNYRDPFTLSGYYVNKSLEETKVIIETQILHKSRSTATVQVSLIQENTLRCQFTCTFGNFNNISGPTKEEKISIALPPIDECMYASDIIRKNLGDSLRISKEFDMMIPKNDPFINVLKNKLHVNNTASISAYVRFVDRHPPTAMTLPFFGDALPPPVLVLGKYDWVPTIEYSIYFFKHSSQDTLRNTNINSSSNNSNSNTSNTNNSIENNISFEPLSDWLRVTFESKHVENGLLYTDGEIRSFDGSHLLAKTRQYARILNRK